MRQRVLVIGLACVGVACGGGNSGSSSGAGGGAATPTPAPTAVTSDFTPPSSADLSSPAESPGRFRIGLATSSDGVTFSTTGRVVSEQAATPDLIRDASGRLLLYYTGWQLGSVTNTAAVAISEDEGRTWAYKNLVLSGFTNGTNYGDPDVIDKPGGGLRMFLTTSIGGGRLGIVYGDSTDGVRFTYGGVAAGVDGDDPIDSATFKVGSTWHMLTLNTRNVIMFHFTAAEPSRFTLVGTLSLQGVGGAHVGAHGYETGGGLRLFSFALPDRHIRSFTTSDGSAWTPEDGIRLAFTQTAIDRAYFKDPAVVRLRDGSHLMAYVTRADE